MKPALLFCKVCLCETIFSYNAIYSPAKLMRDVPEFQPKVSLEEGLSRVLSAMEKRGVIPDIAAPDWENKLIAAQREVGMAAV